MSNNVRIVPPGTAGAQRPSNPSPFSIAELEKDTYPRPLSGPDAVDLAAAVESVIADTSNAIDLIRAGVDLLGSSVLRLASIVALQAKEKR